MIELECLGPLAVRVDGGDAPAELLWRKHLALLVYLARSPRGRTRDHLVGVFWPEKDESKARHSLNEALRVLRRSVGPSVVTDGDRVRLDPGAVAVDADRLDTAAIRGAFLEGFTVPDAPAFEDWLVAERERVRVALLDHLDREAEQALAAGALAAARERATQALAVEPRHEPAARTLMCVHALEGRRVLALQVFERLAEDLERDLGLEPDGATKELAGRIRTERIVRGAQPPDGPHEEPVPLLGSGRTNLAAAVAHWQGVVAGKPAMVVIRGEAGSGKSRLADELAARGRLDGAAVAQARALDGDGPTDIWSALLRGGLEVPELGGASPRALAAVAPLDPDLGVKFSAVARHDPLELDDAVRHVLFAVADARPVLVVLDDVHRAAPGVLAVLSSAVQRAAGVPLGVVVTAPEQSEAVDVLSEHVGRDVPGVVLLTRPFDRAAVTELVAWAFPAYDPEEAARLVRRVLAETAGNPFLAVEFVRAVQSGLKLGDASAQDAVWPAKSRTLDQTMPSDLPETVAAALRRRFRDLSEGAQRTLCAIAVIGGTHPAPVLARASDLTPDASERALDELEWKRWLTGDARGYTFVTKLAQKVVLSDMVTGGQRRRIRERAEASARTETPER